MGLGPNLSNLDPFEFVIDSVGRLCSRSQPEQRAELRRDPALGGRPRAAGIQIAELERWLDRNGSLVFDGLSGFRDITTKS